MPTHPTDNHDVNLQNVLDYEDRQAPAARKTDDDGFMRRVTLQMFLIFVIALVFIAGFGYAIHVMILSGK